VVRAHYPVPASTQEVPARFGLWDGIRGFVAGGGTVLLTTHYLEEAQALASRVVVISGGQIVAQGTVEVIIARAGLSRVRLRAPSLPELPGVARAERSNDHHTLYTADADGLVRVLALRGGVAFTGLQVERASLEEAFLSLTGGGR
jgi:ABC-2 type transport system ATP-binding protein